jgi:hypothetical protein
MVRSRTVPHFVHANAVPSGARTKTQLEYGELARHASAYIDHFA